MRYVSNVDALWKRMEERMRKAEPRMFKLSLRSFRLYIAAVAVLFFLLFSFAGYMTAEWYKASDAVLAYSSLNGKSRICLPDSTFVWLNAGSTLEYFVSCWTKERNVRLDGEAYFEVAADPDRLFVVEGGGVVVKVHGTVFKDHVDVSLLSGLVVVENHGVSRSLNPGETAVCKKSVPSIEKKTTDVSISCLWAKESLRFEKKTIYELAGYLSEWYGMDIRLDPSLPTDQAYTFTITHESLEEVLCLIEYVFDEDNTARITRK